MNAGMSDRIEGLKKRVRTVTAVALAAYALMFAFLLSPQFFYGLTLNDFQQYQALLPFVGALATAIAGYLVMANAHNWLDRNFFKQREAVDSLIMERITGPCNDSLCPRAVGEGILDAEKSTLLDLFYTFIPADDTERERSFSYFTDYFTLVNLSAISIVGMVLAIIIAAAFPLVDTGQRLAFLVLALIAPGSANLLRSSVARKLKYPTRAQTRRILARNRSQLENSLPSYRVYEEKVFCADSGKCPLMRN